MFAVIYKWKVKKGMESAFIEAWAERTEEIKEESGGLGSCLHKSDTEDIWIAYAQWPSKEVWMDAFYKPAKPSEAGKVMKEAVEDFQIVDTLEVVKNLLDYKKQGEE